MVENVVHGIATVLRVVVVVLEVLELPLDEPLAAVLLAPPPVVSRTV